MGKRLRDPNSDSSVQCIKLIQWKTVNYFCKTVYLMCVKSVRIRSFSGPYFLVFGLNMERYGVSLHIQTEGDKIRTIKLRIRTLFTQCTAVNHRKMSKKVHQKICYYFAQNFKVGIFGIGSNTLQHNFCKKKMLFRPTSFLYLIKTIKFLDWLYCSLNIQWSGCRKSFRVFSG